MTENKISKIIEYNKIFEHDNHEDFLSQSDTYRQMWDK